MDEIGTLKVILIVVVPFAVMGDNQAEWRKRVKRVVVLSHRCTVGHASNCVREFLKENKFTMVNERVEATWQADVVNLPLLNS